MCVCVCVFVVCVYLLCVCVSVFVVCMYVCVLIYDSHSMCRGQEDSYLS